MDPSPLTLYVAVAELTRARTHPSARAHGRAPACSGCPARLPRARRPPLAPPVADSSVLAAVHLAPLLQPPCTIDAAMSAANSGALTAPLSSSRARPCRAERPSPPSVAPPSVPLAGVVGVGGHASGLTTPVAAPPSCRSGRSPSRAPAPSAR